MFPALRAILPYFAFILFITGIFVSSPSAKLAAQTWVSGFLRDSNGYLYVNCTNCNGGSGVQSVTAGDASTTIGGTAANPTVAVNQANNYAWSGTHSFGSTTTFTGAATFNGGSTHSGLTNVIGAGGANSCSGANFPGTVYGLCLGANNGATNIYALMVGPALTTFACTASCTAGDSERTAYRYSTTTGAPSTAQCDFYANATLKGMQTTCAAATSGHFKTTMLYNANANNWNGTCASFASFHCVTGTIGSYGGLTESSLTCFQYDTVNHASAVDTGVTMPSGSTYTFTSTVPDGYVGATLTAPLATDAVVWWCWHN